MSFSDHFRLRLVPSPASWGSPWSRPSALTAVGCLALAATLGLISGAATAQVTVASDEDPAPSGSLRSEVEASAGGGTIVFQLGTAPPADAASEDVVPSEIALRVPLVFDNSVTLDNSATDFGFVDLIAPDDGLLLEIQDGVALVLRDVGLSGLQSNADDAISLATATSSLTVDTERSDQSINVNITGLGSLIKEGSSTLSLNGANSFSGGITIRQGDLVGLSGSLANGGTAPIDLAADGAGIVSRVIFDVGAGGSDFLDGSNPSFTDSSSNGGAGFFVKRGEGDLDVGAATLASTIGIVVEEGQLSAGEGTLAGGRNFEIQSEGKLRINSGFNPISSGRISGDGTLELTAAILTLTGDLTGFTGTLATDGGPSLAILIIDPDTAPSGPLSFDINLQADTPANAQLVLVDDDNLTISGNILGNGRIEKSGTGTTTLTGTASHTGGTAIAAGTLVGNTSNIQGAILISDNGTLNLNQASDASFGGSISALQTAATVRKLGAGVLTFDTDQTYPGSLTLEAGGLRFTNGVGLTNADLIAGLGGSSPVTLEAVFDPNVPTAGNTLAIGGDLTIGSNARLTAGLDDGNATVAAATNTVYAATGSASIAPGAELVVQLEPGLYNATPGPPSSQTFAVLTAPGGVTGDFDVIEDFLFFDITGNNTGTAYTLTVSDSGETLATFGSTPNQSTIGGVLDDLLNTGATGDPAIDQLLDELSTLQAGNVAGALEALSPDDLAANLNVRLASAQRTWRGLSNRLALHRHQAVGNGNTRETRREKARRKRRERLERRERSERRRGSRRSRSSDLPSVEAAAARPQTNAQPWVAWFEGSGTFGSLDASDAKAYDYTTVGPILGADTAILPNLRVGFATGGTRSTYDSEDTDDDGRSYGVEATAYAAWTGDPIEALFAFRYGHSWIESDRSIQLGAATSRVEGDFEGDEFGIYAEFSRAFGSLDFIEVAPLLSVAYQRVEFESFDEDGVSPLRLSVDASDIDSAMTSLGLRIAAERSMQEGFVFRPRFKALWNHEWADVEREVAGQFVASATPVRFEGAEVPRDHGEIGLGWEVGYGPNANLFLDWNGRFGEDLIENSVSVGARIAW